MLWKATNCGLDIFDLMQISTCGVSAFASCVKAKPSHKMKKPWVSKIVKKWSTHSDALVVADRFLFNKDWNVLLL